MQGADVKFTKILPIPWPRKPSFATPSQQHDQLAISHVLVRNVVLWLNYVEQRHLSQQIDAMPIKFNSLYNEIHFSDGRKRTFTNKLDFDTAARKYLNHKQDLLDHAIILLNQSPETCALDRYWNSTVLQALYPEPVLCIDTHCHGEILVFLDFSIPIEVRVCEIEAKVKKDGLLQAGLTMAKHLFTQDFTNRSLIVLPKVSEALQETSVVHFSPVLSFHSS